MVRSKKPSGFVGTKALRAETSEVAPASLAGRLWKSGSGIDRAAAYHDGDCSTPIIVFGFQSLAARLHPGTQTAVPHKFGKVLIMFSVNGDKTMLVLLDERAGNARHQGRA